MTKNEYEQFVTNGFFTVRRKDKFWSGTWSDMVIEQSLMRQIKTRGGLCQGKGVSDASLAKWIAGIPFCHLISENVEEFCGVQMTSNVHCTTQRSF